uniref:Class I SAM-dependent methyltransferase n=1 Tax=Schlesneria paludicola TaxID=360056 RepID=A0A7C4LQN6_9PLAN
MSLLQVGIELAERGWAPEWAARMAIRRLCGVRLREDRLRSTEDRERELQAFLADMARSPIAPVPEAANQQHYELPAEFFAAVLGPRQKYSCCYWESADTTLAEAEEAALSLTCQRADLADGQAVLELGCGWGSLSLWMAEHYPRSRVTAVTNSQVQRGWIEQRAAERGLDNVRVLAADMNDFQPQGQTFDRIVSVEMFEHMRNYERLLERIAGWLRPQGKLFVHLFCHRRLVYPYHTEGPANWMGRYFFTGGLMPSEDLLSRFGRHLRVAEQWRWNGRHYQRTAEAWLQNLQRQRVVVLPILAEVYGADAAARWFHRWRLFFLAVAEMFGLNGGEEWFVSHALLQPGTGRAE